MFSSLASMFSSSSSSSSSFDARVPSLRLMTLNAFLLPGAFVGAANASCVRQDTRARAAGELVARGGVDVFVAQEVWGSNTHELERPITSGDRSSRSIDRSGTDDACAHVGSAVVDDDASLARSLRTGDSARGSLDVLPGFASWGHSVLDTLANTLAARGGLYAAVRSSSPRCCALPLLRTWRHTYRRSISWSRKGCIAALLDTSTRWRAARCTRLLVVNTHLDYENRDGAQQAQLAELREFIRACVCDALARDGSGGSGGSGSGGSDDVDVDAAAELGVLVCGDFNIASNDTALFECIVRALAGVDDDDDDDDDVDAAAAKRTTADARTVVHDLFAETHSRADVHTPTYDREHNSLCMWGTARYDYVFAVDRLVVLDVHRGGRGGGDGDGGGGGRRRRRSTLHLRALGARASHVARQPRGAELSDHWPVVVDVCPRATTTTTTTAATTATTTTPATAMSTSTSTSNKL